MAYRSMTAQSRPATRTWCGRRCSRGGASARLVDALIPMPPLEDGEQYRFHFDMTKCIGCQSCEVACNEQNGNPADIKWRRVGELEGGAYRGRAASRPRPTDGIMRALA